MLPNNKNIYSTPQPVKIDEVSLIKLVILLGIFIIPLTFMFVDLTRSFILPVKQSPNLTNQAKNAIGSEDAMDFSLPLPAGAKGNLASVPKEKIDTLFSNLKK